MRRRPGLAGLQRKKKADTLFQQRATDLQNQQLEHIKEQLETFRSALASFARKHKKQINDDPIFRQRFNQMCADVGVDPLASTKGFWSELLGVGDYYYELGVQIMDTCRRHRERTGGVMELTELHKYIRQIRPKTSLDDMERAIAKVACLGNGFRLLRTTGRKNMVVFVPLELSRDHETLLQIAAASCTGYLVASSPPEGWSLERFNRVVNLLLQEGVLWVDHASDAEYRYYVVALHHGGI